jgi:branched-chain amino acid transport system substrate-binding protein
MNKPSLLLGMPLLVLSLSWPALAETARSADYASFILQADTSGTDVIAFAMAGGDTVNLIKQSSEYGLKQKGSTFAAPLTTTNDIESSGLSVGQGFVITQPFYWNLNEANSAWSARFSARQRGQSPSAFHAGVYASARSSYLNVALGAGTNHAQAVIRKMKKAPIDDDLFGPVAVRPVGRIHSMYILKAKSPAASRDKWDLLEQVGVESGPEAFRPLDEGGGALVEQSNNN